MNESSRRMLGLAMVLGIAAACSAVDGDSASGTGAAVVDDEALRNADERVGEWLTYGGNYAETRFSRLDQVDDENVDQLGLAWSFATDTDRGLEATPLVVDGTIYTTGSWSTVFALDARTGLLLWDWDPEVDRAVGRLACCDVVNRGAAFYDGKVYVGVLDGRLAALDAATGEVVWETVTVDQSQPYTITGAPRIVDGKVIIGNGGAEYGVRGYVSAYDADTGELVWRFYTVPGDPSQPFESEAMALAAETWSGEWWEYGGGGTVWDAMAYDPDLDLLYIGTGNGSPWNWHIRSNGEGDNLYLSSIVAVRPDTGEMVWYYQTTPADTWDFTATQHLMLADLEIGGETRQVIMQAPKNGFFYVIDRATGEFISAEPYTEVTWATGVDPQTGRPIEVPGARYEEQLVVMKPGAYGGHNWHPMSFNPDLGLVYIPVHDAQFVYARTEEFEYRPGFWNTGTNLGAMGRTGVPTEPPTGSLLAWDPVAQEERWRVSYPDMWNGGTLATAGNLVFQGTSDGRLVAYTADTGEERWVAEVGAGIIAPPVTYEVDGVQYVAVMAGWGGSYGLQSRGRDFIPGRMLVFALGGSESVLPAGVEEREPPAPIASDATPATIAEGGTLFAQRCAVCHGVEAEAGGGIPDLRYASSETIEQFHEIVLGGTRLEQGMPSFANSLTEGEVDAIRAYVLDRRSELTGQ
ncbi:MAG: PQQ-dependent dehydrogenase, methanol/ethanol family [Gemmatimonadota bacterium]